MFGGYSAMLTIGEHELLLFSDRGSSLTFPLPGTRLPPDHPRRASFSNVWDIGPFSDKFPDIESATRHPETRDYWLGFENFNAVVRYDLTGRFIAARQPPEMRHWPVNGGLEAMTRLADGRFLLLPESRLRGLLFDGDPVEEGATARAFRFALPEPYYATGMVLLPDGRVLVLGRGLRWGWLPFTARLFVGDPAQIGEQDPWQLHEVLDLDAIIPRENWEALAVTPLDDGSIRIWIASDDNFAALQRTLLAQLHWTPPPAESGIAQDGQ
nr:esterase-like activity of phytase family protein [Altererythrobacter sp. KTW20L]